MNVERRTGRGMRVAIGAGFMVVVGIGAANWRSPAPGRTAADAEPRPLHVADVVHGDGSGPGLLDIGPVIGQIDSGVLTDVVTSRPDVSQRPRVDAGPNDVVASTGPRTRDAGRPPLDLPNPPPARFPPSLGGPHDEPPIEVGDAGAIGLRR